MPSQALTVVAPRCVDFAFAREAAKRGRDCECDDEVRVGKLAKHKPVEKRD